MPPLISYTFKVSLEKDRFPNGKVGYFASVPELESLGAATQGRTREEALRNIQDVLAMIVEDLVDEGKKLPRAASISKEPLVTITV